MKRFILTSLIAPALFFGACSSENHSAEMKHDNASHDMQMAGMDIQNVYLVRPLPGRTTAMAIGDVVNHGGSDTLLSVTAPISDRVEIHTHAMEDGVMKMRKVEGGLAIGEKTTHQLKRGADHIMVFNASISEDTMTVPLTFVFAGGGELVVDAKVVNFEDLPEPSEMDHSGH